MRNLALGLAMALAGGAAVAVGSVADGATNGDAAEAATVDTGYWLIDLDGDVSGFGAARMLGGGTPPGQARDVEPTPSGQGYWILEASGVIRSFGDAPAMARAQPHRTEWRSVTATAAGDGLWVFAADGCMAAIGNARGHGNMCGQPLNAPIVGTAITPSGNGYWMVACDGGIFSFGDAVFYGSTGAMALNQPVVGMAVAPGGNGYWLVAEDGGIFALGPGAQFHGSMGQTPLNRPVVGMVGSPTGAGYLMVARDGGLFTFGDVPFHGSLGGQPPGVDIVNVGIYPTRRPGGQNPQATTTTTAPPTTPTTTLAPTTTAPTTTAPTTTAPTTTAPTTTTWAPPVTDLDAYVDWHHIGSGVYCDDGPGAPSFGELITDGRQATMEWHVSSHEGPGSVGPYATTPVTIVSVDIGQWDLGYLIEDGIEVPVGPRIVEIWHPGEVGTHLCSYVTSVTGGSSGIARRGQVWMKIPGGVIPPVPRFGGACTVHRAPTFNSQGFPMNCGRFLGNEPLRWRFNDPPVVLGEPCTPPGGWPATDPINWRWTRQGEGAQCDPVALVWLRRLGWDGLTLRLLRHRGVLA